MATEKEIEAGAHNLRNLARIGRDIGLSMVEAKEAAHAVLAAAEQVRSNEPEANRYQLGFVRGYAKAKEDFNIIEKDEQ